MKYDLKKEKIAVHCQTFDEAYKSLSYAIKLGFKLYETTNIHNEVGGIKEYPYFIIDSDDKIDWYKHKEGVEQDGYQIITASEYLSQFEEVLKYGDKVWDENGNERIFAGFINGICCVFDNIKEKEDFEKGDVYFCITPLKHYRTTDPALDKKVLELTKEEAQKELTKLKGVDSVNIIE